MHQALAVLLPVFAIMQILCAELTIREHMPKVTSNVLGKSAWALSQAADAVRQGKQLDHMKHSQLRRYLLQITTIVSVSLLFLHT